MNTELAQIDSLTSYSYNNNFLNNQPISLVPDHSITHLCKKIRFIELIINERNQKRFF
ncbi:MAG: hypothetical protein ACFFCE_11200 [Promethearchaeota archaeon]